MLIGLIWLRIGTRSGLFKHSNGTIWGNGKFSRTLHLKKVSTKQNIITVAWSVKQFIHLQYYWLKDVQQQSYHFTTIQQSNIYAPPLFDWIITVSQNISHITDTFVSCKQKFKNFIMVEIEIIHLQPFTENHFHFLITLQSASSKVLFQSPKQMVCCTLAYSKCTLSNTQPMDC